MPNKYFPGNLMSLAYIVDVLGLGVISLIASLIRHAEQGLAVSKCGTTDKQVSSPEMKKMFLEGTQKNFNIQSLVWSFDI
jgi:hypothetical protein